MKTMKKLLAIGALFVLAGCNINDILGGLSEEEETSEVVQEGEVDYDTFHKQTMKAKDSPYTHATLHITNHEVVTPSSGTGQTIDNDETAEFTLENGTWTTTYKNSSTSATQDWLQTFKDYVISSAKDVARSTHPDSKYYIEKTGFRYDMVINEDTPNTIYGGTMHMEGLAVSQYNEYAQLVSRVFDLTLSYIVNGVTVTDVSHGEYTATFAL